MCGCIMHVKVILLQLQLRHLSKLWKNLCPLHCSLISKFHMGELMVLIHQECTSLCFLVSNTKVFLHKIHSKIDDWPVKKQVIPHGLHLNLRILWTLPFYPQLL